MSTPTEFVVVRRDDLSLIIEAAICRQQQWQATVEGDLDGCMVELHEADAEEAERMVAMYEASLVRLEQAMQQQS